MQFYVLKEYIVTALKLAKEILKHNQSYSFSND